jgi:hypothetical protein
MILEHEHVVTQWWAATPRSKYRYCVHPDCTFVEYLDV